METFKKLFWGLFLLTAFFAFVSLANAQLADSPWPMFQHDPQLTGRSPYIGPSNPLLAWEIDTGGKITKQFAIGPDGTIYICTSGAGSPMVLACTPGGNIKWSFSPEYGFTGAPAVTQDGTICFSCRNNLYGLTNSGEMKWKYSATDDFYSPVIAPDNTIYATSDEGRLYRFYPNGNVKWFYDLGRQLLCNQPISLDSNGVAYFSPGEAKLYAINSDGSLKWKQTLWTASAPSISTDGTIYVHE